MRSLAILCLIALLSLGAATAANASSMGKSFAEVTNTADKGWKLTPVGSTGTPVTFTYAMVQAQQAARYDQSITGLGGMAFTFTVGAGQSLDGWTLVAKGVNNTTLSLSPVSVSGSANTYTAMIDDQAFLSALWVTPKSTLDVAFTMGNNSLTVYKATFTPYSATPVPAAALLLGTGLCSLLALRGRGRKN